MCFICILMGVVIWNFWRVVGRNKTRNCKLVRSDSASEDNRDCRFWYWGSTYQVLDKLVHVYSHTLECSPSKIVTICLQISRVTSAERIHMFETDPEKICEHRIDHALARDPIVKFMVQNLEQVITAPLRQS